MSNIFQLSEEFKRIEELLIENGGELTEETEAALITTQAALQSKGSGYAGIIHKLQADIAACKEEEDRIAKIRKVRENAVQRLKDYLRDNMRLFDIKKIEFATGSITYVEKNGNEIYDEALIPDEYKEVITTVKIDKVRINADIKEGKAVPGTQNKITNFVMIK